MGRQLEGSWEISFCSKRAWGVVLASLVMFADQFPLLLRDLFCKTLLWERAALLQWRAQGNESTWLILPVVICLSQRLSHACLSISASRRNCEWLIKAVIVYLVMATTWITVVILELIHASKPNFAEGLCLLDTEPTQVPPGHVVIHDNSTNRAALPTMHHSSF